MSKKMSETTRKFTEYLGSNYTDSISLEPITTTEVEKELKKLKPPKSSGYDNINPRVILDVGPIFSHPLAHVFNQTITTGIIPNQL